jgi:hypothetical protein
MEAGFERKNLCAMGRFNEGTGGICSSFAMGEGLTFRPAGLVSRDFDLVRNESFLNPNARPLDGESSFVVVLVDLLGLLLGVDERETVLPSLLLLLFFRVRVLLLRPKAELNSGEDPYPLSTSFTLMLD